MLASSTSKRTRASKYGRMLRSDANDPGSSTPAVAGQLFLRKPTILYHHGKFIVQTRRASDGKTRPCSNRGPIKRACTVRSRDGDPRRFSSKTSFAALSCATLTECTPLPIALQCCSGCLFMKSSDCCFNSKPFQVFDVCFKSECLNGGRHDGRLTGHHLTGAVRV